MDATASGDVLATVFERAPSLVERLRPRLTPADGPRDIVAKARVVVDAMNEREKIAVLDAHPRIGADRATLSALSRREQGDAADLRVLRQLAELNDAYERTFGFRFVVFLAGRSKEQILPVMRERLQRGRAEELRAGMQEFLAISLDRLERG